MVQTGGISQEQKQYNNNIKLNKMLKIIYNQNNPSGIEIDGLAQDKDIYICVANNPGYGFTDPKSFIEDENGVKTYTKYLYEFDMSHAFYVNVFDSIMQSKIAEGIDPSLARDFAVKNCPRISITTPRLQQKHILSVDKSTTVEAGNYDLETLNISNQFIIDWMFDRFGVPKEICSIIPM